MHRSLFSLSTAIRALTYCCGCLMVALGAFSLAAQDERAPLIPPEEEPIFPEAEPDPSEIPAPDLRVDELTGDEGEFPAGPDEAEVRPGEAPVHDAEDEEPAPFSVPEAMKVFSGHVGRWRGLSKSIVDEGGERTTSSARSEWGGGYLMGGHLFELRGYEYGELGRTEYHWQYSYDRLKERYAAVYRDSHGRTFFFEGITNADGTKILWRLVVPPGDMRWETETDLVAEDGLETRGSISSEEFGYNRMYTAVFKRK